MKGSSYVANISFSRSLINCNHPLLIPFHNNIFPTNVTFKPSLAKVNIVQGQKGKSGIVVRCASWGLENNELKIELEDDEIDEEKGKSGMTKFKEKCGERKGVVELLECLEEEAIMGDDVGKEPNDYNRRAKIFDKSSRIFQALKETDSDSTH